MSNKAPDPKEIVTVSSRLPRITWAAMKHEAINAGVPVQHLLEQACRELLAKRGVKADGSTKGRTK